MAASVYPYVGLLARDASDNPIIVELRVASDSGAADESDIVNAVRGFLDGLVGVSVVDATRYTLTETPLQ